MAQNRVGALTKLERLIRSKTPVIAIESYEESRVMAAVQQVAQLPELKGKAVYEWTCSQGLTRILGDENNAPAADETRDVVAAFQAIYKWGNSDGRPEPAIFVMKDAHNFITAPQGGNGDPTAVRFLRDIAGKFQRVPCTLILLSPQISIPPDLAKDVAVMDWPLPSQAEIEKILAAFCKKIDGQRSASGEIVRVNLSNSDREKLVAALQGLTEFEVSSVLSLIAVSTKALDKRGIAFALEEKKQIVAKSEVLEYYEAETSAADIGGLAELKEYTARQRAAFTQEAQAYGLPTPRGFIMVGVPGAGKSLTAKSAAGGEMWIVRLDIGKLLGGLVGSTESNTRAVLRLIDALGKGVLWVDEIEKAFAGMTGSGENDGGVSRRMLGSLLVWMEEHTSPVYIIATSNDVRGLPTELIRRFDDLWFVDLPTTAERVEIINIHLEKVKRNPAKFDIDAVAQATKGFTGAEIRKVVIAALGEGFANGREITTDDLISAAKKIVPVSETNKEKIAELRTWAKGRVRYASKPETAAETTGSALEI